MWAAGLHLLFGNALIGLVEGLLLARFFKAPVGRSVGCMILANYVSGGAGVLLLDDKHLKLPEVTIANLKFWFCALTAVAFVITLVIEFPFIWLSLRTMPHAFRRSIRADLAIHAITYPLLFLIYWTFSGTSLLTRVSVVDVRSLVPSQDYDLYFITPDGKRVVKNRLGDTRQETVIEVSAPTRNDRLFAQKDAQEKYDLGLHLQHYPDPESDKIIVRDFAARASLDCNIENGFTSPPDTWQNHGPASSLTDCSNWKYRTGFWPVQGIHGDNTKDGSRIHFSLETIFFQWAARNATHLQGDSVVFQLGDHQICIMHPPTHRIALVALGKGPVVATPKDKRSR
jgi:hypothetical protein